jgi:hypothetical protein
VALSIYLDISGFIFAQENISKKRKINLANWAEPEGPTQLPGPPAPAQPAVAHRPGGGRGLAGAAAILGRRAPVCAPLHREPSPACAPSPSAALQSRAAAAPVRRRQRRHPTEPPPD